MNSPASDRRGTPDYQQEHVSPISPQTRQDTKGTWQSQGGTWGPFKHGTIASPLGFYGAISCFTRCTADLQRLACSLQDILQCSPLLQCLDLVYLLTSSFLFLPEIMQMLKMWHGKRCCCLAAGGLCLSAGPCTWKSTANKETTTWQPSTASPPTHSNQDTHAGWEMLANKMQFPTPGSILQYIDLSSRGPFDLLAVKGEVHQESSMPWLHLGPTVPLEEQLPLEILEYVQEML